MKNELSLSGVTSQVIELRLSMGVNVLCFELAAILEFSAFKGKFRFLFCVQTKEQGEV